LIALHIGTAEDGGARHPAHPGVGQHRCMRRQVQGGAAAAGVTVADQRPADVMLPSRERIDRTRAGARVFFVGFRVLNSQDIEIAMLEHRDETSC